MSTIYCYIILTAMTIIDFKVTNPTGDVVSTATVDVDHGGYANARPDSASSHHVQVSNIGDTITVVTTDMTVDSKTNTKLWCETTMRLFPDGVWSHPIVYRASPLLLLHIRVCPPDGHPTASEEGHCAMKTKKWQTTFTDEDGPGYSPWVEEEWTGNPFHKRKPVDR